MTGEQLKDWRLRRGLSQRAVGILLRVTSTTVYRWESKRNKIPYWAESLIRLLPAGSIAKQRAQRHKRA